MEVLHDGPQESDEFTGDGNDGDGRGFRGADAVVDLVEPVLGFPGVFDDFKGLPALTFLECDAEARVSSVLPSGLDERALAEDEPTPGVRVPSNYPCRRRASRSPCGHPFRSR